MALILVHAWTTSSWKIFGRLIVFSLLSMTLTALSPFGSNVYAIAQSEGGAHINQLLGNRFAQIVFLILGIVASIKLILQTREKADTGMFLGCMGLSSCCLAFLQIALFWVGIGSNYAIAKHMFVTVAFFIFVVSANIALKKWSPPDFERFGVTKGLAWCSILALLTMRVDLYPSVLDIALAKQWPPNISYGISIGDLRFPMRVADLILEDRPLPQDQVSIAFMPPDDPGVIPECSVPAHSNQDAEAFDYSCVVRSANTRR